MPIPEPHVAGLLAAFVLERLSPTRGIPGPPRWLAKVATGGGALLAAWSVVAAGTVDLARPTRLVTTGPFRLSRNPMYVGWTLGYAGLAAWWRSRWAWILLPVVVGWLHAAVVREERALEGRFGEEWRSYRAHTPRYLWQSSPAQVAGRGRTAAI